MRIITMIIWVALLGLPMLAQDAQKKSNPKRPYIVLIMCDDLGWGDVGFNGNTEVKTPNLDRLAAMGVTLNRFYAAGPD